MTGKAPPQAPPQNEDISPFEQQILNCSNEIADLLPQLAPRYSDLIIATALGQHVAGALRIYMRNGVCTREQAQHILNDINKNTFDTPDDQTSEGG